MGRKERNVNIRNTSEVKPADLYARLKVGERGVEGRIRVKMDS